MWVGLEMCKYSAGRRGHEIMGNTVRITHFVNFLPSRSYYTTSLSILFDKTSLLDRHHLIRRIKTGRQRRRRNEKKVVAILFISLLCFVVVVFFLFYFLYGNLAVISLKRYNQILFQRF